MYRILIFLIVVIVFGNNACSSHKRELAIVESNSPKSDESVAKPYIFEVCESKDDCTVLFDCYNSYFLSGKVLAFETRNESIKYFDFKQLLDCTIYLFNKDTLRKELADSCLYKYYYDYFQYHFSAGTAMWEEHSQLKKWNSKKAFEICILMMEKNSIDYTEGYCVNRGVIFFENIVESRIKTIYGEEFNTYFYKNVKFQIDQKPDCFKSYYDALYPLIKKAWEDGKIVLVSDET